MLKLAICQLQVGKDKIVNIENAMKCVKDAVNKYSANVVCLPECWNSPYATSSFPKYAEKVPNAMEVIDEFMHPTCFAMSQSAMEHNIYVVGGSIPEMEGEFVYNTTTVYDPKGVLIAKFRKMHLFDIHVPGKVSFKESDTLSPGDAFVTFDAYGVRFGVGICYDMRFPMLSMALAHRGAQVLLFPGAFNTTTGPLHWELLLRARAVDNQVFVAGASPAQSENPKDYQAWGHSTIVDPWGKVLAKADAGPKIIVADVDVQTVSTMRENIPIRTQQRNDMYQCTYK